MFILHIILKTKIYLSRPQDPPNDETKANVTGSPLSNVTGPPSNGSQSTTNATLDEHPQEDGRSLMFVAALHFCHNQAFFLFRRRGLQPRQRRPLHSCTNAADGEEGAGVEAPPSALRTRIGRKRKMRDDHEVPL